MKRQILLLPVLAVVAGIGGWWAWHDGAQEGPLLLQGNVDIRQADLGFKVAGRLESLAVEEGDTVVAGQVLARLDQADFRSNLALAQGQVAAAEAALAELRNGSRPEEIDEARAQLEDTEAGLVNARLTFRRQQELLKSGNTPQSSFDLAEANMHQAEAQRNNAKAALALAVLGPRVERIDAAKASLSEAEANLALAEQHLADSQLLAPEDGIILSRVREPGTIVGTGDPVYTVTLTHPTWVRAYVTEPSLEKVHPGQAVEVRTDGGRHYQGRIGYVSPLAEFTPKTVQTPEQRAELVYRLRVVVEQADAFLRQGMPVTVAVAEERGRSP
jgi:HlyD family secretion protein